MGAGFAATDRFIAEVQSNRLRAGYVLVGDEVFLYERCRRAVLEALVPAEMRDFCLSELDLAETNIFEALDRAQTPSLMAPFQVLFLRNLKQLYTRGAKKEEFAALEAYFRSPNPQALVIFVADHLRIPSDPRRMDMQDKDRFERIRETLGDWCGIVELARVDEADALQWMAAEAKRREVTIEPDAARELADALGADMMLIASEVEKLVLYVGAEEAGDAGRCGDDGAGGEAAVAVRADGRNFSEGSSAGAEFVAWAAECFRWWGRFGDRTSIYAGANVSADAGDSGEECAGLAGNLAGAVAGVPDAAVCGGGCDSAGAAVQVAAGADAGAAADCAGGSGAALAASGQAIGAGAAGAGSGERAEGGRRVEPAVRDGVVRVVRSWGQGSKSCASSIASATAMMMVRALVPQR